MASFYADLHIHSKYSRATSRDCDLENLLYWGRKKGITVIGTGDFTHPAWIKEIKEKLLPAEPGLFRLRPEIEKKILEKLPVACQGTTRFMLSVEISTIYKKGDKVRKIHHLVYAPTIEKAEAISAKLAKIGNIRSDGRPILGLDSRHLLEIVLESGEDCFIVPAHIWTPWFAVLGSKSGFDAVHDCYGDLSDHIFAVETGLSSDPEMNRRISNLDRYRLMSNSDAHSPPKLGREANLFHTDLDYYAMLQSLQTGKNYGGTVEFFPEEGKYHLDGHRKCGICFTPEESRKHNGICPKCKSALTLGVLYRVEELADRKEPQKPAQGGDFKSIIPLPEIIGEVVGTGPTSQKVSLEYEKILNQLGSEFEILNDIPPSEIQKASSSLLGEAITRMRSGQVIRQGGYDGEYGVIKLFHEDELQNKLKSSLLFETGISKNQSEPKNKTTGKPVPSAKPMELKKPHQAAKKSSEDLAHLDAEQQQAIEVTKGPLMIIAGPGSGKTRTLTCRIAHLIKNQGVRPEECLAITFTRRAAQEMISRLQHLIPEVWQRVPVMTFHAFGLQMLQENRQTAGLPRGFRTASDEERIALLKKHLKLTPKKAKKILQEVSRIKREGKEWPRGTEVAAAGKILEAIKENKGWLDYDDLIALPVQLLESESWLQSAYQKKYRWISVDEYQDIDPLQYRLIRHLVPENGNLCVIGDPDQAIYGFRGSDVEFFMRFEKDFPTAKKILLKRNYRSGESILTASSQMIFPVTLVQDREIEALIHGTDKVIIHESKTDKAEAEFMVHTIEQLIGGYSFFSVDSGRASGHAAGNLAFGDFAVFYRTEAQAKVLQEAFERSGIPFQAHAHKPLNEIPEVQELLSLIQKSEFRKDLDTCLTNAVNKLAPKNSDSPLWNKIREIAQRAGGSWDQFFSELHLEQELDNWDSRTDKVSLMTLHASKGLEFPVVFIAGCEEGLIPLKWASSNQAELAEERRLFYVGMTRAKEKLILSHAKKRLWQGKIKDQAPSPFLKDIEEKLLERKQTLLKGKPRKKDPQLDLL